MKIRLLIFPILIGSVCVGCSQIASKESIAKSWIGERFERLTNSGRDIVSERVNNSGNHIYATDDCPEKEGVYPTPDMDCIIYWEVNSEGVIVGSEVDENSWKRKKQ